MSKEFIPYEQALALKELGFDEPCFAHLIGFGDGTIENGKYVINYQQVFYPNDFIKSDDKSEELGLHPFSICGVPLYQQVFRWFREKHGLQFWIEPSFKSEYQTDGYVYYVKNNGSYSIDYATYEEAEHACINKLIEIVKGGKQ